MLNEKLYERLNESYKVTQTRKLDNVLFIHEISKWVLVNATTVIFMFFFFLFCLRSEGTEELKLLDR